jgi:hypothetical protein
MGTTFMDRQQKQLLKKFYALLGKTGAGQAGKEAILQAYGVESSKDLSAHDLMDICNKLAMQADPKLAALDRLRKRVIRAIFVYCEAAGKRADMEYVKSVACRAAGCKAFNGIPAERLNNLYYAFKNKVKDIQAVGSIAADDLLRNINLN